MPQNDFTNQSIETTYQQVLQTDGTALYDGTGSLVVLNYTGSFAGDGSQLTAISTASFSFTSSYVSVINGGTY